jgi:sirohydrochlorin ferrochelatase
VNTLEAVVYICHGSRVKESKEESFSLIDRVKKLVDVPIQETCFLELQQPSIQEAVAHVIHKGATKVVFLPILLLTAGHAKIDIPEIIIKEQKKHPSIAFYYGRPIEVEPKMIDAVTDHIHQLTQDYEQYDFLFVGRGSSDVQALEDTNTIISLLQKKFPNNTIEACFLAASKPRFEELLVEKVTKQKKSVLIVPYLLFTGLLIKGMRKYMESISLEPNQKIIMSEYLGHHENVVQVLADRVEEARGERSRLAKVD